MLAGDAGAPRGVRRPKVIVDLIEFGETAARKAVFLFAGSVF
jgi:hypothetical protein